MSVKNLDVLDDLRSSRISSVAVPLAVVTVFCFAYLMHTPHAVRGSQPSSRQPQSVTKSVPAAPAGSAVTPLSHLPTVPVPATLPPAQQTPGTAASTPSAPAGASKNTTSHGKTSDDTAAKPARSLVHATLNALP